MSTITATQPRAGGLRSHRLLIGLGLFSIAAVGVVTLAPPIAVSLGNSGQLSFPVMAGSGVVLISPTSGLCARPSAPCSRGSPSRS
jgi:hypothetical protein